MPIRTATLNRQIKNNGVRLHLAIVSREHAHGADQPPSAAEQALHEERAKLKLARAQRQAAAKAPKPVAAKPVKVVKPKPVKAPKPEKAPKAPKDAKQVKGAKPGAAVHKPTRSEKQAKKAENLEAAKKADKKSAKT